jgi:glycosyltransferase involved in cell wall biosynthesis
VPYLLINTRRVLRFMKKEQINILHSNDHFNLVPVLAKAMAGKQIKLLVHVRLLPSTYNYQLYNVFRRLNVYYADRIIGVSEAIMDAYERPQKMIMIRDKIELSENHPVYIPQKKSNFKFVYISNYIQGKGQNFAVDAFQQLVVRYPQAELHFYGGTMGLEKNEHYKEQLKERVVDQKMDHLVFFHSFAADTERAYKDADVSLCFSESESFSLICLESQFYGVPVIASACGGPQEIIRHEENGLLVANRNVREMAAAMSLLLENFELRKKLSVNGRENAKSLLQATPSFCDVLKEVERI